MKLAKFYTIILIAILANQMIIQAEEINKSDVTNELKNNESVKRQEERSENKGNIKISDILKGGTKDKGNKQISNSQGNQPKYKRPPKKLRETGKGKKNNKNKKPVTKKAREEFRQRSSGRSSMRSGRSSLSSSRSAGRSSLGSRSVGRSSRPLSSSFFGRPVYSGRGYYGRPYSAGYLGWPYSSYYWGWGGAYWWPYFSWRWLRGIYYYPLTYIRSHRENCLDVCEVYAASCENYRVKYDSKGYLKCSCGDSSDDVVVEKYCWTPRKCILAKEIGCETIIKKIIQKKSVLEDDDFNKKRK